MARLLLELRSEEIPARMQARAAEDLKRLFTAGLAERGLQAADVETFAGPRRLTLFAWGLEPQQPERREERKGPKVGAPQAAIQGFLKAAGLTTLEAAEQRETDKGPIYVAVTVRPGVATAALIPDIIRAVVAGFPWPKSMRWSNSRATWVRPLTGILCSFDGVALSFEVPLGPGMTLESTATTDGHRFLGERGLPVETVSAYRSVLRANKVMLDPGERRRTILNQATFAAAEAGFQLREDPGLLDEVIGLVEWPVVLMGRIDARFMAVPAEVLVLTMRTNQKYFALEHPDGRLADRFLLVSNMETEDEGARIIAGNERVLRARLADAEFFWTQDRKQRLETRIDSLKSLIFHAKLGTVYSKVTRVEALAVALADAIPGAAPADVQRAARLSKADLTTGMVGEFPELQGIMGRYYAQHDGETPAVAAAIADHYAPLGPSDRCPNVQAAPVSVAVALADKLDTLVGFFMIDERPTGSKDPFALRRAALGAIRLIVENKLRIGLLGVLGAAGRLYGSVDVQTGNVAADAPLARTFTEDQRQALLEFIVDRLKVALRDQGVRHDLISAVFALQGEDDLVRALARVAALGAFLETDDGTNLLAAYRRACNILRIEEKKDGHSHAGPADPARLVEAEERALFERLGGAAGACDAALAIEDFAGAMTALSSLRAPVDAFFERVLVNAPDPALRENRLRLLSGIRRTLDRVADLQHVEG